MSDPVEDASQPTGERSNMFEELGRKLDERPEVQAAEEALRRAREQLDKAQQCYEQVRRQAAEGVKHWREQNVGDLVDSTLALMRKYPAPGVLLAALLGFFVGRVFRR